MSLVFFALSNCVISSVFLHSLRFCHTSVVLCKKISEAWWYPDMGGWGRGVVICYMETMSLNKERSINIHSSACPCSTCHSLDSSVYAWHCHCSADTGLSQSLLIIISRTKINDQQDGFSLVVCLHCYHKCSLDASSYLRVSNSFSVRLVSETFIPCEG